SIAIEFLLIHRVDGINHVSLQISAHSFRIIQIQYGITFGAALHPLIHRRKKSASPNTFACIRSFSPRSKYDEAREILILCSQSISYPASQTWSSKSCTTRLH